MANKRGRKSGVGNLEKIEGGVRNRYGVEFTNAEQKALKTAVDTANRKRNRMLKAEAQLPRMIGGKETGDTKAALHLMGQESDFILAKKTKSLQRFRSKDEFERYMANLRRVNQRDYIKKRVQQYQKNHATSVLRELNDAETAAKIAALDPSDYMRVSEMYEDELEIHYVYGPDQRDDKIDAINTAIDSFVDTLSSSKQQKYHQELEKNTGVMESRVVSEMEYNLKRKKRRKKKQRG